MNRKNRKKCIRQAAANAQRIHRNGVDLLVVQSPGFRHLMLFPCTTQEHSLSPVAKTCPSEWRKRSP